MSEKEEHRAESTTPAPSRYVRVSTKTCYPVCDPEEERFSSQLVGKFLRKDKDDDSDKDTPQEVEVCEAPKGRSVAGV